MKHLIAVAVGGALGSCTRYLITRWTAKILGVSFPYGTLAVNALGCLLIGSLAGVAGGARSLPETWRLALTVGGLGGLTTFSSFSFETLTLLQRSAYGLAAAYFLGTLVCGVPLAALGYAITSRVP